MGHWTFIMQQQQLIDTERGWESRSLTAWNSALARTQAWLFSSHFEKDSTKADENKCQNLCRFVVCLSCQYSVYCSIRKHWSITFRDALLIFALLLLLNQSGRASLAGIITRVWHQTLQLHKAWNKWLRLWEFKMILRRYLQKELGTPDYLIGLQENSRL